MKAGATGAQWILRLHTTEPANLPRVPLARATLRRKLRSNGLGIGRRQLQRKRTAATGLPKPGASWIEKTQPAGTASGEPLNNASMSAAEGGRAAVVEAVVGPEAGEAGAWAAGAEGEGWLWVSNKSTR